MRSLLLASVLFAGSLACPLAGAAFVHQDGSVADPARFKPKLTPQAKAEFMRKYVSGLVGGDKNLQAPPRRGWREFNEYVARTAPFFDAEDRRQIIAQVNQRAPGLFFNDAETSGGAVLDKNTGAEIKTDVPVPKSEPISQKDMWPVLYNYLESLKPANGEFSYPPVSYGYRNMAKEQIRRIISRVRPDLKPGDIEIEDVVSFLERKGFFSGDVSLLKSDFERYLELGKYLNSVRSGKVPDLGKDRTVVNYWRLAGFKLRQLGLDEEESNRLIGYLVHWRIVEPPERFPAADSRKLAQLGKYSAAIGEKSKELSSGLAAGAPDGYKMGDLGEFNASGGARPQDSGKPSEPPQAVIGGKSEPAHGPAFKTSAQKPEEASKENVSSAESLPTKGGAGAAASVFGGIVEDLKDKFLPWRKKKSQQSEPRRDIPEQAQVPVDDRPKADAGKGSALGDFMLPDEIRTSSSVAASVVVSQISSGAVVSTSAAVSSVPSSDEADFYGELKADLLRGSGRKPVEKLQDYELLIPLLSDGTVYPGYDQLLAAANAELAQHPKSLKALLKRADAYYGLKRYSEALRDAEASLSIQRDLHAYELISWSLYKMGQDEKAYRSTSSGLRFNQDATELLLAAAKASERMGRYGAMLEDLEKAAEVDQEQFGKLFERCYAEYGDKAPDFQPTLFPHLKHARPGLIKMFRQRFGHLMPFAGIGLVAFLLMFSVWSAKKKGEEEEQDIVVDSVEPDPVQEGVVGGRYKPESLLYHDAGGIVYKGVDIPTGSPVVINKYTTELPREQKRSLLKDKNKLLALSHPNIGLTYDILEVKEQFYVVTDFVGGTNLEEKLSQEPFIMSLSEARKMCVDVLRALEYLHSRHVVYGVLRTTDIQINQEGISRLINVGIGSVIDRNNNRWIGFIAPEALTGRYTEKSDFYALGVCFYRAVTGVVPDTSGLDPHAKPPSKMVKTLPKKIDRFFEDLLSSEPLRRPDTAAEFQSRLESITS